MEEGAGVETEKLVRRTVFYAWAVATGASGLVQRNVAGISLYLPGAANIDLSLQLAIRGEDSHVLIYQGAETEIYKDKSDLNTQRSFKALHDMKKNDYQISIPGDKALIIYQTPSSSAKKSYFSASWTTLPNHIPQPLAPVQQPPPPKFHHPLHMSTGKRGIESPPQSGKAGVAFHCDPPHCHWKAGVEEEAKAKAEAKTKADEAAAEKAKASAEKAHARPATASAIHPLSREGVVSGTKRTRGCRRSRSWHSFTDRVMDFLLGDPDSHKSPLASSRSRKSVSDGGYSAEGRERYEGGRGRNGGDVSEIVGTRARGSSAYSGASARRPSSTHILLSMPQNPLGLAKLQSLVLLRERRIHNNRAFSKQLHRQEAQDAQQVSASEDRAAGEGEANGLEAEEGDVVHQRLLEGGLLECFDKAKGVVNGTISLEQRDILVAEIEKAANAAEERLVKMANDTRAAFQAAQQVGQDGMALLMRKVNYLKLVAEEGVKTAVKAVADATSSLMSVISAEKSVEKIKASEKAASTAQKAEQIHTLPPLTSKIHSTVKWLVQGSNKDVRVDRKHLEHVAMPRTQASTSLLPPSKSGTTRNSGAVREAGGPVHTQEEERANRNDLIIPKPKQEQNGERVRNKYENLWKAHSGTWLFKEPMS